MTIKYNKRLLVRKGAERKALGTNAKYRMGKDLWKIVWSVSFWARGAVFICIGTFSQGEKGILIRKDLSGN